MTHESITRHARQLTSRLGWPKLASRRTLTLALALALALALTLALTLTLNRR